MIILVLLAFVAGFSQEQYAVTACIAYALFFIVHVKDYDRIMRLQHIVIGIALAIGSAILILAPGIITEVHWLKVRVYL